MVPSRQCLFTYCSFWFHLEGTCKQQYNCRVFMEPPTMLLVPICRDMQLWWDKPPIPSPRNRMPGDTCFDDVGRNCACVTWQGSHTGQHKKFPEFSLSFPWDIWKFQSYFEPFIQISKGNSLPKEVSWRNIHEKFCYSNESYGLLTPLTASLSSTFWLTASFKCSLHIYQVIHKWLFDCNLKNRGLHWMTTMFCMSPMLKWTWA